MDRCRFFKELSSYLDNQLPEAKRRSVEEHIRNCRLCAEELSRLKQLSEKLKAWQAPDLGPEFDSAVKNTIVREEIQGGEVKMKTKTLWYLVPSGALAGILILALFSNAYFKQGMQGRLKESDLQSGAQFVSGKSGYEYKSRSPEAIVSFGEQARPAAERYQYNNWGNKQEVVTSMAGYSVMEGSRVGDKRMADGKQYEPYYAQNYSMREREEAARGTAGGGYTGEIGSTEGPVIVIQPVLPATGEGDKIIRTADVRLEVEDGKGAYKKVSDICQELGGYLASSNFYKDKEGREAGTLTLRIPKEKFLIALDKLSALGKVESSATNSQDVGQEYANLKARLDAAMVVYNKTLEALQKKQVSIPEAARLESELTPVLQRVQNLKNQIEYLNNAVSFTTITVYFHEPKVSAKILKESKKYIQDSMLTAGINAIRFMARAIPFTIVLAIWLVILVVIAFVVKILIVRLFKRG